MIPCKWIVGINPKVMQNPLENMHTATADHPADAALAARFAASLRRARLAVGLTASTLSKRISDDRTVISRLESARRLPSLTTVLRLCRALSVPLSALLPDEPLSDVDEDSTDGSAAPATTTTEGSERPHRPLAALASQADRRT